MFGAMSSDLARIVVAQVDGQTWCALFTMLGKNKLPYGKNEQVASWCTPRTVCTTWQRVRSFHHR